MQSKLNDTYLGGGVVYYWVATQVAFVDVTHLEVS